MKTIGCFLIAVALATGSSAAFASKECDWAVQVNKDEPHRIGARNARINQIKAESAEEQRRINNEIQPKLDIWNHTLNVYDTKVNSMREAVFAIEQIGEYLEGSASSDLSLKLVLEQIRNSQRLSPDRRLAEQLRVIARTNNMSADARESLQGLANTVNLLEKTQAEFAVAEAKLIEDYLSGRNTLVNGMLDTLHHIAERLRSDLQQLEAGHNQDRATAADLAKQIADAKVRQAARENEIQSLNEANAASAANMSRWSVEVHCPVREHHPIFPLPT